MYLLTYLLGALFSFRKSPYLFYGYLLVLWLLASFRFGVGPDYFAYYDLYSSLEDSVLREFQVESGQEILFRLFGAALKTISVPYEVYSSIVALVSLFYIGAAARKYSTSPILSLFLYYAFFYLVWTYSGIRQGLTLSIGTYYLLESIYYRKHIKFFLIVTLLAMIHSSSIILLLFYALSMLNFGSRTLALLIIASIIFSLFPIVDYIGYLSFIPLLDRVLIYAQHFNFEAVKIFDFKSISRIGFMLLGFIALHYYRDSLFHRRVISIYIISFPLYFLLKFSEILAANLTMYGFILSIFIIPFLSLKINKNKIIYLIFIYVISFIFLLKNLDGIESMAGVQHSEFILPYTHIFSPNEYQIDGPR